MAFAKKMMGFPSDLVSFSAKLPSKRHEKIHVTFLQRIHEFTSPCLKHFKVREVVSLPCKKYDMDSQGNSMSFHVTTRLGGSLVQIYTKFHDYSMSFIQVLFVFHAEK